MKEIRLSRRTFTGLATMAAATMAAAGIVGPRTAFSQSSLPRGPITLVVPFAAGGATDVVSRLVAAKASERIGRPIIIDNAGGAGGVLGATRVARGSPDGSILLMGTVATHAINPLMAKKKPYDPLTDFSPISLLATVPNVLLVGSQVKAGNVRELIALLKSEPGRFSYGSSGVGTPPHLSGELFKAMAGVDMTHVPYRGGGPAMVDLMGGQIPILFDVLSGAASFVRDGAVRALGVTTKTRSPSFPDIPTISEAGLPDYETYTWNAVFGPAGMPRELVDYLSGELRLAVADPEVRRRLADLSAEPVGSTPEALKRQVETELAKWEPVINAAGLKQG
jgi:tripartite-type tricarboxylate transporter receptor subunit TctC